MGGWLKLFAILLMIGTAGYRYYHHGSFSAPASASTSATATQTAQVAAPAPAAASPKSPDNEYLTNYMTTIQRSDRAYPYGTTVRNVSLPSGRAAQVTISKTKTGYCPIRKQDTYSVSISVTTH
ncbi:MAG: hypothetical protein EPN97_10640 [Alphaproteobacteria bacterium]|nr:MAG: hypothetical protein EPN97_10640 [Alphaproteobacteria bacterium]